MFASKFFKEIAKTKKFTELSSKSFGRSGPYNPNRYKDYFVPRNLPKNEEIFEFI